jgi:hypothetical protein
MGKSEQKQARTDVAAEKARIQKQTDTFSSGLDPERAQAKARADAGYADLSSRYTGLADTGGIDPAQQAKLRAGFGSLASTGGYDPRVSDRVGAGYSQLTKTGGYSPTDVNNIRSRSNSAIPAVYGRLQEGLRRQNVMGGGSAGFGATTAKLGRQAAEAAATTARDTELGISDRIREGRLTGLQGEQGLQESLRQGRVAGLQGGQTFEESIRAGKLGGFGGLQQLMGLAMNEQGQIDAKKLEAMGLNAGQISQMMEQQRQLSMTPGLFDNIIRGVGAGAGLVSAFNPVSSAAKTATGGWGSGRSQSPS